MSHPIRHQTVVLIGKLLHPLTESNLIPFPEYREIIAQLKHLAAQGTPVPNVVPKLVDMNEAAQMLGVSLANFKKLEPQLPFKRKMVGHAVRIQPDRISIAPAVLQRKNSRAFHSELYWKPVPAEQQLLKQRFTMASSFFRRRKFKDSTKGEPKALLCWRE